MTARRHPPRHRSRHRGRHLALALLVVAGATACSVSDVLGLPSCNEESSTVLISAQSVPTAQLIFCFEPIPTGWEVDTVDITHEGTVVVFDSDRAGGRAAVLRYESECDVGDATSTPTEFADTVRFEWVLELEPRFRANRYYRFEGGCVTWEFDFDPDAPAAMAVELGGTMQFVGRQEVNDAVRREFVEEDL